ncbi:hypothetical protein CROQUDRAFT_650022 [Cronartium quercuum f. sp. fusiforme G11]|uniref:Secreted protein n=1 Tax=Cronartium quercuum f. sp. fusiforme G11 TaxID=708437 RepID=A0A9P6TIB0_9BASI|nr:hypothetical protein CROQUDRAFT_650022 [Cronartium quercuum f. sp. fusiforme G11]
MIHVPLLISIFLLAQPAQSAVKPGAVYVVTWKSTHAQGQSLQGTGVVSVVQSSVCNHADNNFNFNAFFSPYVPKTWSMRMTHAPDTPHYVGSTCGARSKVTLAVSSYSKDIELRIHLWNVCTDSKSCPQKDKSAVIGCQLDKGPPGTTQSVNFLGTDYPCH